jgi:predicted DNA-binding protein (UPF0251 family)
MNLITMTRPRKWCRIGFCPEAECFWPDDTPEEELEVIELSPEEAESLRLKNIEELEQTEAAKKMGISQSTFQRILSSAHKKMSEALIYGKAIKIQKREEKK